MNKLRALAFALAALVATAISAQEDLSGTWAGTLAVAPGSELEIHFVLTRGDGGAYSAVLTSPDTGGIKDVPASEVSFADGRLALTVDALSGAYEGTLANGVIEGQWQQEGQTFPLSLTPYTRPVLSQEDKDFLTGEWLGKLDAAGLQLTIVSRFEQNADGELVGVLLSPDQGPNEFPISDIELVDGELAFKIPQLRGEYTGAVEGESLVGTWSQGQALPLTLTRGSYEAPTFTLDLPAATFEALAGAWRGQLGPLALVFRFETNAAGQMLGYVDSPNQNASGIPITGASFADGRLTLEIMSVGGRFVGAIERDMLTGEWTQLGMTSPLTLTRE